MKTLVVLIVVIAVVWIVMSRRSSSKPLKTERMTSPANSQPTYTSRMLEIFGSDTMELGEAWRTEPATEKQIARLSEIVSEGDISLPASLTKGQASDAIGLFHDPEWAESEKLKFFKVPNAKNFNQTEARRALYELFANPENAERWENRPASTEQKDKIRFFGEKVAKGLKHREAAKIIDELAQSNSARLERWDELRSGYETAVDPENRELYDIKRFTWAQFCEVAEEMESEGQLLSDILWDEEKIYEILLKKHPSLEK